MSRALCPSQSRLTTTTHRGLLLAAVILLAWLASLLGLLSLDLSRLHGAALVALVVVSTLGRTWLQTGLFIVGHDAMHGVLVLERRGWNDRLGVVALALYAALPYVACSRNHQNHHRFTASADDPDFHGDPRAGTLGWYRRFMAGYLSAGQMMRLLGGWGLLALIACRLHPAGWINVLLFCTLPLLLSSLQLFVFGTYLPHRRQRLPHQQSQADSLDLPPWLSLLACYHFGYHREHHDSPQLAWFELPAQHRRARPSRRDPGLAAA
ncbi:fatty acid desaturase [Cyanobium sp. Alchichica 3B3-8F6]|uniref:fatty acid desaturase n=1 Tax=Cyanobium sp. Alchichica 3B3-8F6 TaxID=2823696 RepID=UPI0020CE0A9E|nr:fatty acid desaturase [Cyanobium sp. Alchichica 3B3-8F6]